MLPNDSTDATGGQPATETLGPAGSPGTGNRESQRIYLCRTPADLGSRGQDNTAAPLSERNVTTHRGRSSVKKTNLGLGSISSYALETDWLAAVAGLELRNVILRNAL
jgi:hypothetical protein